MIKKNNDIGVLFIKTALLLLVIALCFGILSAFVYKHASFLKEEINFSSLRPLHVSTAIFWIILGATGCVYKGIEEYSQQKANSILGKLQWMLWIIAIAGIIYSYFIQDFGGREYWEFNPIWALPIAGAWVLFLFNFYSIVRKIKNWPVYIWMWVTGITFFLFCFIENYLWQFSYFRENFVVDMTIQWKVNGSLVGAWNQMLYGTAFYLMDKIDNKKSIGSSKIAFFLYFLGLFNLMFNWGHHIYTLPTEKYIRYIGYIVSMTEWVFFIKIIYNWKSEVSIINKLKYNYPYKFLAATNVWVFINMGQAILMSIPALNLYTHGTHVTVAHAMGTTIGINSMILLAACFIFLHPDKDKIKNDSKYLNFAFWTLQISLTIFWLALNWAGIEKGIWQLNPNSSSFSVMMRQLQLQFTIFLIAGFGIFISMLMLIQVLLIPKNKTRN